MEQYYLKLGHEGGIASKGSPPIDGNVYFTFSTDRPPTSKGYVFHVDGQCTWYDATDEELQKKSTEIVNQGNFCMMGTFMVTLPINE